MTRIGVVLSGCGVMDGSEIHEAALLLLAIDKAGAEAVCLAPDKPQADVVDHLRNQPSFESRNVLAESARIARGKVRPLAEAKASELDAVILPGGFGAAKNLSTFAKDGAACQVDPELARLLRELREAGKPIGAACIAPVILAKLFGKARVTIGTDAGTAKAVGAMGARHVEAPPAGVVVDHELRLATTPCYMSARRISEVAQGMEKLVAAVLELRAEAARR